MKKLIFLFVLTICPLAVFATDFSEYLKDMTKDQKEQFLNNALSVIAKTISISQGSGSGYTYSDEFRFLFGMTNNKSTDYADWDVYLGPSKISRLDFYELTGQDKLYDSLAESVARIKRKRKSGLYYTIGGSVIAAVGAGLLIYGLQKEDDDNPYVWWGAGIALVSCIPLEIGISNLSYSEKEDVSLSFATGLADMYNAELAARIKFSY